jgi:hypothetical protein
VSPAESQVGRVADREPGAVVDEPDRSCRAGSTERYAAGWQNAEGRSTNELTERMAVTIYGVVAVTFMMVMYSLERRGRVFVLGFAGGCVLSSVYGFLSGAWPFGVVELIWSTIAVRRYNTAT